MRITEAEHVRKDQTPTAAARDLMVDYLERVAEHFGFVRVGATEDLDRARAMLATDDGDEVLLHVQLAHARQPELLGGARTSSEFLRRLDRLIVEAARKVSDDNLHRAHLARIPESERAGDTGFRDGALRAGADRWRSR